MPPGTLAAIPVSGKLPAVRGEIRVNGASVAPSERIAYGRGHYKPVVEACMGKGRLLLVVIVVGIIEPASLCRQDHPAPQPVDTS